MMQHLPTLSRDQARELDRRATADYGVPSIVLMENAGRGVADTLCRLGTAGPIVICCGRGNNGGDGFVVARHLNLRGLDVKVLVWDDPSAAGDRAADAAANYRIIERSGVPLARLSDAAGMADQLAGAAWVVDALLGTGARGEPRAPLDAVIAAINASGVPVLAVDLPSGLDCDTGAAASRTIRAAHTCTFVAHKPGFLTPGAAQFTGRIHVVDIGAPRSLVDGIIAGR
jgi:NAD(P)H-hydrate epimerase